MVDQIRLVEGDSRAKTSASSSYHDYKQNVILEPLLALRPDLFPDTEACLQMLGAAAGHEIRVRYESSGYRQVTRWVSGLPLVWRSASINSTS